MNVLLRFAFYLFSIKITANTVAWGKHERRARALGKRPFCPRASFVLALLGLKKTETTTTQVTNTGNGWIPTFKTQFVPGVGTIPYKQLGMCGTKGYGLRAFCYGF